MSLIITSAVSITSNAKTNNTDKPINFNNEVVTDAYTKGDSSTYLELGDIKLRDEKKVKETKAILYSQFRTGKISKSDYLEKVEELNISNDEKQYIEGVMTFEEEAKVRSMQKLTLEQEEKLKNTADYTLAKNTSSRAASGMIWDLFQYPQEKNYYCGPATAKSILGARGYNPTQATLASYDWLETEYWEGTPWWVGSASGGYNPMQYTLNKYQGISYYTLYGSTVTTNDVKVRVPYSIDRDYGVAGNVWEVPGGTYLPGHPQGYEIFHWVAIDGYYDYGDSIHYAEPVYNASSVSWYQNVTNKFYTVSTSTMAYVLDGRGMIW